ncbi:MAG: amidohydrolase family protein [Methanomassiliicoccales archaeon]
MAKVTALIRARWVVPGYDCEPIRDGAVAIAGNTIADVGLYSILAEQYRGVEELGGDEFLLIPGLVNGHSHGRGLTDFQRGALDNTLESWLFDTRKYIPISTYDDVAFSAVRLLKSGVTTTMHNHILKNPDDYENEFEEALRAYRDTGLRVQFNPAIRNSNPFVYGDNEKFLNSLPDKLKQFLISVPSRGGVSGTNYVDAVSSLHARYDGPMSRIGFGPLAPQWCTKELLQEIRKAADRLRTPIHIHAMQSIFQKIYGLKYLGKTLIEYMDEIGFLGPRLVIGHCVWPTASDIELMAKTGTGVTHHPSCNLRVRNGIAPVFHMIETGVKVGLGLDGKSINDDDDMIQEMKVCFLLHRISSLELDSPYLLPRRVFQMATENSAHLLGYGDVLGRLEPGCYADLVLINYDEMCYPFVNSEHDPLEVLLYRGKGRHVDTVIVNGRVVVQEGKVTTVDEEALATRLREAASRPPTSQETTLIAMMDELKGHVIRYYEGWTEKVRVEPFYSPNSRIKGMP